MPEIFYHCNVSNWLFQRKIIYLIVIKKRQSVLSKDLGSLILYPFYRTRKNINKFCLCFLFVISWTATLMPKQAQRIDIILPFYPFELKLYFSSPRPTYFWERRQSKDCSAEKRMGNATGQILHLINIPSLTTCILLQGVFLVRPKKWLIVRLHVNPFKKVLSVRIS